MPAPKNNTKINKVAPRSQRANKLRGAADALEVLFALKDASAKLMLARLWLHWEMVMGDELANITLPIGEHNRVLVIGAEDNMLLQDLTFMTTEILARANAFMNQLYFVKIKLELLQGRTPLYPPQQIIKRENLPQNAIIYASPAYEGYLTPEGSRILPVSVHNRPRPEKLGSLSEKLDPSSPVAKAYESYLRSFE